MKSLLILLSICLTGFGNKCINDKCKEAPQSVIHVNMGAHSHLDAFWLQTYSEYLNGTGHDGVHHWVNVKALYSGVLSALLKDEKRTYQMAEVCYIKPWFESLTVEDKQSFRKLLRNGQIEILNGGWVQNDEASPFYDEIIDQLTIGHQFLYQEFKIIPEIGFMVDNFGHSMTQAAIYSQMGFNGQIIARLDTEDIAQRTQRGNLDFIMEPKPSTGVFKDRLLTQVRYKRHGPWKWHQESVRNYDCHQKESTFKPFQDYVTESTQAYHSKNIYYYAGDDFQFFNEDRFQALQALIDFYQDQPCRGIDVQFSSPTRYFQKMIKERTQWERKHFDFFPYWEDGLYWTGYFTSSPDYKIIFRNANRYLQTYRKLFSKGIVQKLMTESEFEKYNQNLIKLQEEVAMSTHHDGVTATSKYRVMDDVVQRIKRAMNDVEQDEIKLLKLLTRKDQEYQKCDQAIMCTNIMQSNDKVELVVFNPKQSYQEIIEISLPTDQSFEVEGINGEFICLEEKKCKLVFKAQLVGFGFTSFYFTKKTRSNYPTKNYQSIKKDQEGVFVLDNSNNKGLVSKKIQIESDWKSIKYVLVDTVSGNEESYEFSLSFEFYKGISSQQWSSWDHHYFYAQCGKYVMMNDNKRQVFVLPESLQYIESNHYLELIINWKQQAVTKLKFLKESNQADVDIVTDWNGKRLSTDWKDYVLVVKHKNITKQDFYVDSNGLVMIQRKRSWREDFKPVYNATDIVPGNYYPMTAVSLIQDKYQRMVVMTDRSQGVASLDDGEIEINIDRLAGEDGRGVGETLNRRVDHQFKHRLLFQQFDRSSNVDSYFKSYYQWNEQPIGYLSSIQTIESLTSSVKNININQFKRITFWPLTIDSLMVRIQNVDERQSHKFNMLSESGTSDFLSILHTEDKAVKAKIEETTLNGLRLMKQQKKERWDVDSSGQNQVPDSEIYDGSNQLTFQPRQIRTFVVQIRETIEEQWQVLNEKGEPTLTQNQEIEQQKEKEERTDENEEEEESDESDEGDENEINDKTVDKDDGDKDPNQENKNLNQELQSNNENWLNNQDEIDIDQILKDSPRPAIRCNYSSVFSVTLLLILIMAV